MKIKMVLMAGCLALAGVCESQANIITFNFTGTSPGQNSPWNTGTITDPNVTTTGFTLGSGVSGKSGNNRFNASGWSGATLASAVSDNDYFGFVLTPASGYAVNLDSATITFTLQTSADGPQNYALMISLDGFGAGDQLQGGIISSGTQISYTFAASGLDNISSPIEFRIYGYDANSGSGTMSVTNSLSLGGTVAPAVVPEPAKTGLVSGIGLLAILGLDTWRRRSNLRLS